MIATARTPTKVEAEFAPLGIRVLPLDVTDDVSVRAAAVQAIREFGKIDVVVNNAGYGLVGVFETAGDDQIKRQFDTNYFGVMRVMRAFLPHFRENKDGTFVNVSSIGGRFSMPIYSAYHGTKFALEGFSESVQYELEPLGIRVKLVEPGPVATEFTSGSQDVSDARNIAAYDQFQRHVVDKMLEAAETMSEHPIETAKVIFKAANDRSLKQRFVSGRQAKLFSVMNWLLPETCNRSIMKKTIGY